MIKKILLLVMLVIMTVSLAGCSSKTIEFDILDDMQAFLPNDLYYYEFDNAIYGEASEIYVVEWNKSIHNGNPQYRYSIWYDIVNGEDDQEYRLNIVGTHVHKPITITERYIKTDKIIDNSVVIYIEEIGDYYYYFILQGNMQVPEETSIEYFKTMIQSVVATKYKVET